MVQISARPDQDLQNKLSIFGAGSHPQLVADICACLGIPKGAVEITRFANDNIFVQILENVREKDVFVLQTSVPPVNERLMELFLLIDALKHASARRVTAVLPYFPYARSDKKDEPRICIAARLVADLLEASGADRVLTMNLHSDQIQGFFGIPVDQLDAVALICDYFEERGVKDFVALAPDAGSARRAGKYAERLGIDLAIADKRRSPNHDDTTYLRAIVGDVEGKNVIVFDDEIATGGSMLNLCSLLATECNVGRIFAAATHGVLVNSAPERLQASAFEQIVVTDTVPLAPEKRIEKIEVLSVASLLADAIRAIHTGTSVSDLFL